MKKVMIVLRVSSIDEASEFYCNELGMFEFEQDFGMGQISLTYNENKSIVLLLHEGKQQATDPVFHLEVNDCDTIFKRLKSMSFKTGGLLMNDEVFEYPLGKNLTLKDPSGNMFLLYEDYYPAS